MTDAPALSVLLSVKDGARHLPASLETLLAQSFRDFELIAVDDASRDATPEILAAHAARDPRLRVETRAESRGLAAALNLALSRARAPVCARADADDLYHPERFARQMARLAAEPELGLLSCGHHRIDEAGRRIDTRTPPTGDAPMRFEMMFMNPILHPGAMFRTELVRRVGGYDEAYWTAQDSDLWARLAPLARMDNLPEPLVSYRIHAASTMKTRGAAGRALSLSVPRRLLSAYLGREMPEAEARAAVDLYQGFERMEFAEARLGERVLAQVRAAARREPAAVRAAFRARVARGLMRQAWFAPRPAEAAALHLASLRWRPSRAALSGLARAARGRAAPATA